MQRPVRKGVTQAWLGLLAALWIPASSPAFSLDDHMHITLESLDAIVSRSAQDSPPGTQEVYRFAPVYAEQVADANRAMDFGSSPGFPVTLPEEHFDDDLLSRGAHRVIDLQRQIVTDLLQANIADAATLSRQADDARLLLGEALHTVQDFYAHSNWVELHDGGPPNGAIADFDTLPPGGQNRAGACASQGTTLVTSELLTAFHEAQDERAASNFCVHGRPASVAPEFESLAGFAKDDDTSPGHAGARAAAVIASATFVQTILARLESAGAHRAICAFLGRERCEPASAGKVDRKMRPRIASAVPESSPPNERTPLDAP